MKKSEIKIGIDVNVSETYRNDEVNENNDTTPIATVLSKPTDNEELVLILYKNGTIDYVPQSELTPTKRPIKSIKLVDDFFNKAAKRIDSIFYPTVKYYGDNKQTIKIHRTFELFSNGCLGYSKMIERIAKACSITPEVIELLLQEYIKISY
jgi:flagellar basal body rod protein FlgF